MALGCAFIFIVIIWLFRRRQRKKRAAQFAKGFSVPEEKIGWKWKFIRFCERLFCLTPSQRVPIIGGATKERTGWQWKLIHFGEKLFCLTPSRQVPVIRRVDVEDVKLTHLRMMEEARPVVTDYNNHHQMYRSGGREEHQQQEEEEDQDLVRLIGSYYYTNRHVQVHLADQRSSLLSDASSQHTAPSMYSQVTGLPHNVPEPRQPLKSRFSMSTFATTEVRKNHNQSGKKAFWK
jgi:hypothetical protein